MAAKFPAKFLSAIKFYFWIALSMTYMIVLFSLTLISLKSESKYAEEKNFTFKTSIRTEVSEIVSLRKSRIAFSWRVPFSELIKCSTKSSIVFSGKFKSLN